MTVVLPERGPGGLLPIVLTGQPVLHHPAAPVTEFATTRVPASAPPPAPLDRRTGRLAPLVRGGETVFVCGSARFAEGATTALLDAGVPVEAIRVERFGPSS